MTSRRAGTILSGCTTFSPYRSLEMSFVVGALRILLILFVVRLVGRAVAALFRPASRPRATPKMEGIDLVRDRVCNTFLPREQAIRSVVAGREEHFCSAGCRDQALAGSSRAS